MSHTINITDLTDQDVVRRALLEIQSHGTSYALVQDGVEVAKFVPVEKERDWTKHEKVSPEVTKKRWEALEKIDEFVKSIAHEWNTDKNAAELVAAMGR
jgi:hypothetical protein